MLYVDEINLLADHLVDALLDVAVSGVNRIERDGISHTHRARFVLVGSMNPEEGELRPQLLDRFGLAVDVTAPLDVEARAGAVQRQLAAEGMGAVDDRFAAEDDELRQRLRQARPAPIPDDVVDVACRLAVAVGAEGLRADLMLCRAAAMHAGWSGQPLTTEDDVRRVAPLVLSHRRRRMPFDDAGLTEEALDEAFDHATAPPRPYDAGAGSEQVVPPAEERLPPHLGSRRETGSPPAGRRSTSLGPTGRYLRDQPMGEAGGPVAVVPTAVAAASRRATEASPGPGPGKTALASDLREAVREQRTGNLVIIAVDTSGSMGAQRRIAAAKGAVLGLLADAYQRRDRVALIAFRGEGAEVVLRPTASVEVAKARLAELPTGGATPLAAGLEAALALATGAGADGGRNPLLVLITDGRATAGGTDPLDAAGRSAARLAQAGVPGVVIDAEDGHRLGLARQLATTMGADHLLLDQLAPGQVEQAIRLRLRP